MNTSLKEKITAIKKLTKKEKLDLEKKMRMLVKTNFSKEDFIASHEKLYTKLST